MENAERDLIKKIIPFSSTLQKLYKRHLKLEKEVEHLEKYIPYSTSAAMEHSTLKKQKLRGKEQMMAIIEGMRPELNC